MRRLNHQLDEQRTPRTSATLDQLLDRYLETLDVGRTTHRMCTRYLKKHVRPFFGRTKVGIGPALRSPAVSRFRSLV